MALLDQILTAARSRLPALRSRATELEREARSRPQPPSFAEALRSTVVGLITEVKRRSPSAGDINPGLDPLELAGKYQAGGASAISVLTETEHFGGTMADLARVAGSLPLPVLRKDFIVDELQLVEARAAGAAAALLIVRALSQQELEALIRAAEALQLTPLVEAHDQGELERALTAGAEVIGINARNLDDFSMDVGTSLHLLSTIPAGKVAVAESGMSSLTDVVRAADAGADAVLIGGALAAAGDPQARTAELTGVPRRGR